MERLTKPSRHGDRYVSAIGSGAGCWGEIVNRLAAYENTGLEPEEIADLVNPKPLTREELAQMDGEPVWVVNSPDKHDEGFNDEWALVHSYFDTVESTGTIYRFEFCGKKWTAYRNKPKEV